MGGHGGVQLSRGGVSGFNTERCGYEFSRMQRFVEPQKNKNPQRVSDEGFWNLILTMTYSHMGKPHTTIGDTSFHC
ncbi:hypothetical protein ALP54_101622 [Pseudomonas amygdali pv. lachrymans]|nr:hypothetical protein ALP54_101622 [Pseudomonas amygdali pv. lachrymans]